MTTAVLHACMGTIHVVINGPVGHLCSDHLCGDSALIIEKGIRRYTLQLNSSIQYATCRLMRLSIKSTSRPLYACF